MVVQYSVYRTICWRLPQVVQRTNGKAPRDGDVTCNLVVITEYPSKYPTGEGEEEEEEVVGVVVVIVDWDPTAVDRFLTKWDNAAFGVPPPFDRLNNARGFHRRMLEYLTENITGAVVTTNCSVDCGNSPADEYLLLAIPHLEKEQWVRTIIDTQPTGWDDMLGAISIPHSGRSVHLRLRDNLTFKYSCKT